MSKKNQTIRLRIDEDMHKAIDELAVRAYRSKQDQARYLLAKGLEAELREQAATPTVRHTRHPRSA